LDRRNDVDLFYIVFFVHVYFRADGYHAVPGRVFLHIPIRDDNSFFHGDTFDGMGDIDSSKPSHLFRALTGMGSPGYSLSGMYAGDFYFPEFSVGFFPECSLSMDDGGIFWFCTYFTGFRKNNEIGSTLCGGIGG
jgi:hypothetical protein